MKILDSVHISFTNQSLLERIIERLVERAIEKIGFVLIDLLAPHAIDFATNLFLNISEGLEKLADYLHDKFYGDQTLIIAPRFIIDCQSDPQLTLLGEHDIVSLEKINLNQFSIE